MTAKTHFVYLLRCADGSYYAGYTTDLQRRLAQHNAGTAAKYTRGRVPVNLVYFEQFFTKSEAMIREYALKQLNHQKKHQLAAVGLQKTAEQKETETSDC